MFRAKENLTKSQEVLLRLLGQHQGWPLYRKLLWREYNETCVDAQTASDPAKKLALLSKAEGQRVALDLWKDITTSDEDADEIMEEVS